MSTLGLGKPRGDITLGTVERDLKEPDVGRHDLRGHRDLVHSVSALHLELQIDVDALIDHFITLVANCVTLNCTSLGTPQKNFLDPSLQQVLGVLTATSWSKFVGGLGSLTTASVDALELLDNCGCVTERRLDAVHTTLGKIVDGLLALQRLCLQTDIKETRFAKFDGRPVVAGLTRLMKALAIEGRSVVLLNGIASLSQLDDLSDLGVGPVSEKK